VCRYLSHKRSQLSSFLEKCEHSKIDDCRGQIKMIDYLIDGHFSRDIEQGKYDGKH